MVCPLQRQKNSGLGLLKPLEKRVINENKAWGYPVQFKLEVLNFMKQTDASYEDTAIRFNLNQPSLITTWHSKLLK